ncbi:MAG: TonB-dependent receptor [Bacteroidia bacterium]|nr:TonB-dependent receptor [Bacteroidia bacterium]
MIKTLLLPSILLSTSAFSQNATTDSIKTTVLSPITIVGDRAKSIPGSGQYISIQKLENLNQTNFNNVLRTVPGVNVRDEEGFGLRPNIGLRGTPVNRSAKITLMEDGILIAPAPYADPSAYYFPTFARMQGVEVLKGSSQIKYGPYTIGGAVNLLSTAIPTSFKGHSLASYGSFGTNQQRVWIGDSGENIDYVFDVNRLASNGFKKLDGGGNTGFDKRDIMGKIRLHTNDSAKIKQSAMLKFVNSIEDGNETYLGLTFEDYKASPLRRYAVTQKDILDMNHSDVSLNYTILPLKGLTISTTAYYTTTFRDWARANTVGGQNLNSILSTPNAYQSQYQIMIGNANGNIDYQRAARTYYAKGVQTNVQHIFSTGAISHKIHLGVRYHEDQVSRYATRSTYAMTSGTMILTSAGINGNQENQLRSATSLATYLSYDISYKGLKISPGVRYEDIYFKLQNFGTNDNARIGTNIVSATNHVSIVLPGVGVNYSISKHMSMFGGAHKGFSPPGTPSTTSTTGQAIGETSINYEMGYSYDNNNRFNVQLVGFLNNYDNILGSDNISGGGAGTGNTFNAGNAKIQGVELNLTYNLLRNKQTNTASKLPISIAYTYNDAKFQETFKNAGGDWGTGTINKGDLIPFITPHLLTASVGYENKKFNTTLTGRYTGVTKTKPSQDQIITPTNAIAYNDVNAIAEFLIIDLSANYKLNRLFTVFTTVNNITNNKAIIANLPQGYRPNMPLSFNLGLKANF